MNEARLDELEDDLDAYDEDRKGENP